MTITAFVPLLVAVVGLLLYFLATKTPKLQEAGRISFAVGLFVFLLPMAERAVKLGL